MQHIYIDNQIITKIHINIGCHEVKLLKNYFKDVYLKKITIFLNLKLINKSKAHLFVD